MPPPAEQGRARRLVSAANAAEQVLLDLSQGAVASVTKWCRSWCQAASRAPDLEVATASTPESVAWLRVIRWFAERRQWSPPSARLRRYTGIAEVCRGRGGPAGCRSCRPRGKLAYCWPSPKGSAEDWRSLCRTEHRRHGSHSLRVGHPTSQLAADSLPLQAPEGR